MLDRLMDRILVLHLDAGSSRMRSATLARRVHWPKQPDGLGGRLRAYCGGSADTRAVLHRVVRRHASSGDRSAAPGAPPACWSSPSWRV
jgi:hypothetical protein